jgi:hypothetical protein
VHAQQPKKNARIGFLDARPNIPLFTAIHRGSSREPRPPVLEVDVCERLFTAPNHSPVAPDWRRELCGSRQGSSTLTSTKDARRSRPRARCLWAIPAAPAGRSRCAPWAELQPWGQCDRQLPLAAMRLTADDLSHQWHKPARRL